MRSHRGTCQLQETGDNVRTLPSVAAAAATAAADAAAAAVAATPAAVVAATTVDHLKKSVSSFSQVTSP